MPRAISPTCCSPCSATRTPASTAPRPRPAISAADGSHMPEVPTPAEVLARLDKLLADRPHRIGHDFSEATRALTALRDRLVLHMRAGDAPPEAAETLARLNAVLSVVVGTHYP